MTAEEYHSSLRPLEDACRQAGSGWICLRNPLVGIRQGRVTVLEEPHSDSPY